MNFENLIDYIVTKYNCHTIILYGSFAKGDFDEESDIDLLGFSSTEIEIQDKSAFENRALDLWIYNDNKIDNPDEFIHIRSGRILLDKNNRARAFLTNINLVFQNGPELKSYDAKLNSINWLEKMLLRTSKNDIEGQYRLHWLLTDILPIYFDLIDRWYLGSKESFAWLKENDDEAYNLFERLYADSSDLNIEETILFMKSKLKQNVI